MHHGVIQTGGSQSLIAGAADFMKYLIQSQPCIG
jgi:hypothetical protein